MNGNALVISELLSELDLMDVREFCVCAGARNAPIIEALVQKRMSIRHFFDERGAAFFALGRVMQTRLPVAVLTTSGTAVAELFPAIIEAYYQNLPLVAITADRPSRYAGSGAPQAIEQEKIFGSYISGMWCDIEHVPDRGLVATNKVVLGYGTRHINVRLEEGLVDSYDNEKIQSSDETERVDEPPQPDQWLGWHEFWNQESSLIVLAGGIHPSDVATVRDFLLNLGAPVVAEATANLTAEIVLHGLLKAGGEAALQQLAPARVLRIGAVPSWRWWRDLEKSDKIFVLNISRAEFSGMARKTGVITVPWSALKMANFLDRPAPAVMGPMKRGADLARFMEGGLLLPRYAQPATDREMHDAIASRLNSSLDEFPDSEPAWMRQLSRIIGPNVMVFLGNSLPIREWNLAADPVKPGTSLFANRGANGIDGLVSTWLGVSAEAKESWLIAGDLSALSDLNAPWILSQLPAAKRRIVVINNGGGKIFSQVGSLESLSDDAKKIMANPHAMSFEPWARMWGLGYRLLTHWNELGDNDDASATCEVWEIRPDAKSTKGFWNAWRG